MTFYVIDLETFYGLEFKTIRCMTKPVAGISNQGNGGIKTGFACITGNK